MDGATRLRDELTLLLSAVLDDTPARLNEAFSRSGRPARGWFARFLSGVLL